jgi:1,6-anhydro-N-acetylmuramate kinase
LKTCFLLAKVDYIQGGERLTWCRLGEAEANLKRVHDTLRVLLMIHFIEGEAISVLHSTIAEGKTDNSPKQSSGDGDHDLGQNDWIETAEVWH